MQPSRLKRDCGGNSLAEIEDWGQACPGATNSI